jgi:hypothetical protein
MGLPGFTAARLVSAGVSPPRAMAPPHQAARRGVTPAANGFDPIEIDPLDDIARRLSEESEREAEEAFRRQAWEYAERKTEQDIAAEAAGVGDLAIAAAEFLAAVGIGLVIGGGGGLLSEQALLATAPAPGRLTPGCITNPIAPRVRTIKDSSWGCERGLVNAQLAADAVCASIPGQCSGAGPTGIPCTARHTMVPGTLIQSPGWLGFWCNTSFAYTCECG